MRPVITLITDFGTADHYVGTMKGVILNINPEVQFVDICHHVSPYEIFEAAYALVQSYRFFPKGTIHLVVVDPGVGSARRPILASAGQYKFVAPDNGVLSLLFAREENVRVWHVTSDHYFLNPVSNTFHGRDIFAPVAGWLSRGVEEDKFGEAHQRLRTVLLSQTQVGERKPDEGNDFEIGLVWEPHHQHQPRGRPPNLRGESSGFQDNYRPPGNYPAQLVLFHGPALRAFCHRRQFRFHRDLHQPRFRRQAARCRPRYGSGGCHRRGNASVRQTVEKTVHDLNTEIVVFDVTSLERREEFASFGQRVAGTFVGAFGLVALILAAIGIYAVTSYTTRQRTHEIGIRMTLGATQGNVLRLVLSRGARLMIYGITLGLVLAFVLTRFLDSLLLGVTSTDAVTFAGVALLLSAVTLFACLLPALRAMRVDPMVALRE